MLWRMSVDSHPRGSTQMAASRQLVAQTTLHRDKGAVDRHQHGVLSVRQPAPRAALLHGPNRIFRALWRPKIRSTAFRTPWTSQQTSGGKGGNLQSLGTGLFSMTARSGANPAETGGNPAMSRPTGSSGKFRVVRKGRKGRKPLAPIRRAGVANTIDRPRRTLRPPVCAARRGGNSLPELWLENLSAVLLSHPRDAVQTLIGVSLAGIAQTARVGGCRLARNSGRSSAVTNISAPNVFSPNVFRSLAPLAQPSSGWRQVSSHCHIFVIGQ